MGTKCMHYANTSSSEYHDKGSSLFFLSLHLEITFYNVASHHL